MAYLPDKAHLLPHEVKKFLGISRTTLYRYLKDGIIPSVRIGDMYRIPREDLVKWYESQPRNGRAA